MIIGARAHDFGRHAPERLAGLVGDAGFDGVQLALTKAIDGIDSFDGVTPAQLEAVRTAFSAAGVEISVLGCYVEPSLPDREARLEQVRRFCLGLEHAAALGVPLAGTETTNFPPGGPGREAVYHLLLDSVQRMVERAEALGVDIAVETVADHTLNSAALTRRLLDEINSPRLGVIFDPVNLLLPGLENDQERIYSEFFQLVGRDIRAVHLKDIVMTGEEKQWRNIGQGTVRYDLITPWLRKHKPDIPLLREHVRPESAATDLLAMRRLAGMTE